MHALLPPRLTMLLAAAMIALRFSAPGPVLIHQPWSWLGLAPLVGGLVLMLAGARHFSRARTNIKTFDAPTSLVDDGLFRLSRNPMYLGFALLLTGLAVMLQTAAPFAGPLAFLAAAQFWYIPFEERAMRERFGQAYEVYARRVRRWL